MSNQKQLIPMMPGDILRTAREDQGLTIAQVAEKTKIRAVVLDAIESGETGDIAPVYLRGYINRYARFLQVDFDDFEGLENPAQGMEPEVQSVFTHARASSSTDRWLKATSYVVASALVAALVWQFTHEAVRFSQGEQKLPQAVVTPDKAGPETESAPASHVNASIASIEVIRQRGQVSGSSAAEEAWAAIAQPVEPEQDTPTALMPEGGVALALTTSADSWVEILDARGQHIEMDLIRAGTSRSYHGVPPLRILLGRASAVELIFDGDRIDLAPHTRGNVVRMTLGQEADAEQAQQTATDPG
jgi:cytoskeleton protein RodZ